MNPRINRRWLSLRIAMIREKKRRRKRHLNAGRWRWRFAPRVHEALGWIDVPSMYLCLNVVLFLTLNLTSLNYIICQVQGEWPTKSNPENAPRAQQCFSEKQGRTSPMLWLQIAHHWFGKQRRKQKELTCEISHVHVCMFAAANFTLYIMYITLSWRNCFNSWLSFCG